MKSIYTKSFLPVLAAVVAFGAFPFFNASADTAKPKIRHIEAVTSRTVLLPITWDQYNKSVDTKVKVRITNLATGAVMFQQFDTRFNGNGHGKVTVKGLRAGTDYAFKVKVRKITLKDFSDYSSRKTAMTLRGAVPAVSNDVSADQAAGVPVSQ